MERGHLSSIGFGAFLAQSSSSLALPEELLLASELRAQKSKAQEPSKSPSAPTNVPAPKKAAPKKAAPTKAQPPVALVKSSLPQDDAARSFGFLEEPITQSLQAGGRCFGRPAGDVIRTRFPPEPNGYLHIGHAKSICVNFGLAQKYGGYTNLRFDDTNPVTEETEFVESIMDDVRWLGFEWKNLTYSSDTFDQLYEWAELLIQNGKAYVESQNLADMRTNRKIGKDSPFRNRTVEENMTLFREMKAGKHKEGTHVLRAKIDMKNPNMSMRDPPMYRILHKSHHRTKDKWCIYPIYDWAHGQGDALEGITHSICTLEFKDHNDVYQWFCNNLPIDFKPIQYEFSRLNLTNAVMSKRKLKKLVQEKLVDGWDDPRMPTICGMRRRGVSAEALRNFCAQIGVTEKVGWTQASVLEDCMRGDLEAKCHRRFAVLYPLKLVIETYPAKKVEEFEVSNHPDEALKAGKRTVHFTREVYIEREDFREEPPQGYERLTPTRSVKLRHAYVISVKEVKKNKKGEITEVVCTHDPESLESITAADGSKVRAIHWVDAKHGFKSSVRLYDYLLKTDEDAEIVETPAEGEDEEDTGDAWLKDVNPNSIVDLKDAVLEGSLKAALPGESFQFERTGFFVVDKYSKPNLPVFNRTVGLKEDTHKPDKGKDKAADDRRALQAKQALEKEAKKKLNPKDMFQSSGEYSKFDENGVPTHAKDESELPKSKIKKLKAEWEKQKKLFESQ